MRRGQPKKSATLLIKSEKTSDVCNKIRIWIGPEHVAESGKKIRLRDGGLEKIWSATWLT